MLPLSTRGGYQLSVAFERQNGHLESTSVKPCGFMLLRGAFASPEHHLPLEPGFSLDVVEKPKLDADGVWLLLTGESSDAATGVSVSPAESGFGGLGRWLSLHLPGMCTLTAQGDAVELGIVPCLFGYGKDPKFCHTRGSINETSLAVLARGAPPPDSESSESFELVVRTYGPRSDAGRARNGAGESLGRRRQAGYSGLESEGVADRVALHASENRGRDPKEIESNRGRLGVARHERTATALTQELRPALEKAIQLPMFVGELWLIISMKTAPACRAALGSRERETGLL